MNNWQIGHQGLKKENLPPPQPMATPIHAVEGDEVLSKKLPVFHSKTNIRQISSRNNDGVINLIKPTKVFKKPQFAR